METIVPTSLPSLKELNLLNIRMDDQVLHNLLLGCLLLEKLRVEFCEGLISPRVSSSCMKSVKFMTGAMHHQAIEVDAPNLHSFVHIVNALQQPA